MKVSYEEFFRQIERRNKEDENENRCKKKSSYY